MTDVATSIDVQSPVDADVVAVPMPSHPARPRLGDLLLKAGLVSAVELAHALSAQRERRKRLGEILREDGVLDEIELAAVLAVQLDTPLVDLRERPSDDGALRMLGEIDARRLWVLPLAFSGSDDASLLVATDDPSNRSLFDEVELIVGRPIIPMLSLRSEIDDAIRHRYRVTGDLEAQVSAFTSRRPVVAPAPVRTLSPGLEGLSDAPVVQIVNLLVAQALRDRASDLHLEPHATGLRIRARVDGILREVAALPADLAPGLVSRIKILAELNIVEKQRAQDGQITFDIDGRKVDVRVATMRTIWGEKVVMRLLDRDRAVLRLDTAWCSGGCPPRLPEAPWVALRDGHRRRPDGQRQDHDAVRVDQRARPGGTQRHHDRGPGRVHVRERQPDPGQRRGGPDVRPRPAGHPAAGPRCDPGRRDARPGNGARLPSRPR